MDAKHITSEALTGCGFSEMPPNRQTESVDGLHCHCCDFGTSHQSRTTGAWEREAWVSEEQTCRCSVLLELSRWLPVVWLSCKDFEHLLQAIQDDGAEVWRQELEAALQPLALPAAGRKAEAHTLGARPVSWERAIQEALTFGREGSLPLSRIA